jgi:hypothetical protein
MVFSMTGTIRIFTDFDSKTQDIQYNDDTMQTIVNSIARSMPHNITGITLSHFVMALDEKAKIRHFVATNVDFDTILAESTTSSSGNREFLDVHGL